MVCATFVNILCNISGKKVTSDAGVLLLAQAEKRLGIASRLVALFPDKRDPTRVQHLLPDILFARYLAIAAGYEDANDLDHLCHVRRLIRRIRTRWPKTQILLRGDGHYSRPEVMAWCEAQKDVDYIFGQPGNAVLRRDPVITAAAACAAMKVEKNLATHRTHCETTYAARSWNGVKRRIIARIETTSLGLDIRTIVTSLPGSTPECLYEANYCARGQAENLIKLHKTQLKSDRTSCSSACANQMRLILHTAAYWLLWEVRL